MVGVELSVEGAPFVAEAMQRGLLINCTHDFTLRLLPPFIITRTQVRDFLKLFQAVLESTAKANVATISAVVVPSAKLAHGAAR